MTDIPTLPDTIRLLTLNVLSPSHAYWPRRRNLLRDCLSALRPDVVALQEVVWGNGA
jgi:mRNA deadenylase 3'-5' endonuclease subunit Ccr4